jgi:hypothetical protein
MTCMGPPIRDPDPDRAPIGHVGDDRLRAEGRCPMRSGQLMPIIAFPTGGRSPLPAPAVPGRQTDLHLGGRPGLYSQGGRWGPVCSRPCRGAVDVWAAQDEAGHEHATREGRHEQRQSSLYGVPPFLTSWDGGGDAHSGVWGGMRCIARGVRLIPSACADGLAVHSRIGTCDYLPHSYVRLSYGHRIHEGIRKVKQKSVIVACRIASHACMRLRAPCRITDGYFSHRTGCEFDKPRSLNFSQFGWVRR